MAMTPVTLTADKKIPKLSQPKLLEVPMAASATIYMGSLVGVTDSTGLAVGATDATGVTFLGIADEQKTCGAVAGSTRIRVATDFIARMTVDASMTIAATNLGLEAYACGTGNITNSTNASNDLPVGMIVSVPTDQIGVSTGKVDVWIEPGKISGAIRGRVT
jgi:hypothetical protein